MALPTRLRRHADQAGQGHVRDAEGLSPDSQPQSTMAGPSADSQPDDPTTGTMPNQQPEHQIVEPAASPTPTPTPKPKPLAHIKPGMRLDLSRGVWIEPDDND